MSSTAAEDTPPSNQYHGMSREQLGSILMNSGGNFDDIPDAESFKIAWEESAKPIDEHREYVLSHPDEFSDNLSIEEKIVLRKDYLARIEKLPPHYITELLDNHGRRTGRFVLNYSEYSDYLSKIFNIVNFKNVLYIYDPEKCIYRANTNEINTHIRDTFVKYSLPGKLQAAVLELGVHLQSMGNFDEYPFNKDPCKIPVLNGVIHISYDTGKIELLKHGSEHLFTYKLCVTYNPKIPKSNAETLLGEWVDNEVINALLQVPAQALLQMQMGHSFKKAYLLQGEAHAGKTSYLTLLSKLFSPEYIASVRLQQICEDKFVGGKLEGKLLNIYDDLEDVPLGTIDAFKAITGSCVHGVERKYEGGYVGRVTAVHVFTCNYPPEYPEKVKRDSAFWARWEYIKFPNTYQVDPNFYERVFTDDMLSSFFNAILWAMVEIKKKGLLASSDVQTVMGEWSVNSDPMYDFISWGFGSEVGKTTVNHYSKTKLYAAYLEYCKESNLPEHKIKNTAKAFTLALQPHNFIPMRIRVKKMSYEVYATSVYKVNPTHLKDLAVDDVGQTTY